MPVSNLRVGWHLGLFAVNRVNRVNRMQGSVADLANNWLPSTQQLGPQRSTRRRAGLGPVGPCHRNVCAPRPQTSDPDR